MPSSTSIDSEIQTAVRVLGKGGVVGMPTETVYGLAARIDLPEGIEAIFKTKERPFFDPLIVHIFDRSQLTGLVSEFSSAAVALAKAFWPGPLTMVLPKNTSVNTMITSGLETVGVRMPKHPVAFELLKAVGVPLAAPSANKFGKTSPTSAEHVRAEFRKENVFVLEGGESEIGIESTVLSVKELNGVTQLSILRPGHILKSEIEAVLNAAGMRFQFVEKLDRKESPGHMKHHYMPTVPLVVCERGAWSADQLRREIETRIAELPDKIEDVKIEKPLHGIRTFAEVVLPDNPLLATRKFYAQLRTLAEGGAHGMKPDCLVLYREEFHCGERWQSLYDRINKAASLILTPS